MNASNPILQTISLSKKFGGLEAVKSVNLTVERGEVRAIIGPNGAGKTTLANMISGRIEPTSGKILFNGKDISGLKASDRVIIGIAHTFQLISLFKNLTVFENVELAVQRRLMRKKLDAILLDSKLLEREANEVLSQVGLLDVSDQQSSSLPYGYQRLLDVALAIALKPELLILDEPTQGLSAEESKPIMDLIRTLSKGRTILLIEHDLSAVFELASKITVMDKGSIIAEGDREEIESDREVRRAYLGI